MGVNVGIDFGTSNSGVSIVRNGQVKILPVDPKNPVPEVVKTILYITRDGKSYIGQEAVELYYRHNINRKRRFVKKWVGETEFVGGDMFYVTDLYAYVDELTPGRLLQFIKTALRTEGFDGTNVFDKYYSIGDIVRIYLQDLKRRSEDILGEPISGATIGRPVKFSSTPELDQKSEDTLRKAAIDAGFKEVSFEFEPVAAGLYYEQSLQSPENVLIFDFGGGTLDVTILRLGDPSHRKIFANGGIDIAGSDFDRSIIQQRMLRHFGKGRIDHRHDLLDLVNAVSDWMVLPELSVPKARLKLIQASLDKDAPVQMKALESLIFNDLAFSFYNAVETAKINLSNQGASLIQLHDKNIDLWELYTRHQFEEDIEVYKKRIETFLIQIVQSSGLEIKDIQAVVKTGGSSNIPLFANMLETMFGKQRVRSSNAFSSVTAGLGICAKNAY
jgi:hypothetical chaperone protein